MHQKKAAEQEENGEGRDEKTGGDGDALKNPFADEEEDEDADSDDEDRYGSGAAAAVAGAWGASGRGSWWRGAGRGGRDQRFDGEDDSDEDDDDDEEFGDFAMPEVEPAPGTDPNEKVILKPLAVHPPAQGAGGASGGKAFSGLWPFSSGKDEGGGVGEKDGTAQAQAAGEDEKPVQAAVEAARRTSIEDPDDDEEQVVVQKPSGL